VCLKMASAAEARHRAKVYCLNDDGKWDDRGTGHAAVQFMPLQAAAFIVVMSEEDTTSCLLQTRVHLQDIYQRQQDTIVSWNEPENGVDYALSFQDPEGCTELWEQICSLQGRSPDEPPGNTADGSAAAFQEEPSNADALTELPACEMRNLAPLAELLAETPLFRRGKLADAFLGQEYIPRLVEMFGTVEDLESKDDLHHMFHIFRGLVMLNDTRIYELLLREDLLMGVIGALEYDPELATHQVRHREFLRDRSRFKQVIPIEDDGVLKKIHQNFYLAYIKDVVLPRSLDDNTFATLSQIAFLNNVHIVSNLTSDPSFLPRLRHKMGEVYDAALLEAMRLLNEICSLAKQLQPYNRAAFYRKFVDCRFFDALEPALTHADPALRLCCLDVMLATVLHDPSLLRQHILQQRPECAMMQGLLQVLSTAEGNGEKPQVAEVLRNLLDPEGMERREQDDFLNTFYESFVSQLAAPVAGKVQSGTGPMNGGDTADPDLDDAELDGGVLSSRQHVCELLCFCVHKHSYRIKYFILRNNVLVKVLKLISHRDKCLVLAALRFFRACIGSRDEFYNRYVVKNKCFEGVMRQLLANRHRDNLLHSAILELFEFIRRENIKSLVAHLAETYQEQLSKLTHVEIFKGLLLRYEQNEEYKGLAPRNASDGGATASITANPQPAIGYHGGRRTFPDDDDDEAYFNESDEEDDAAGGDRALAADSTQPHSMDTAWMGPQQAPQHAVANGEDRHASVFRHELSAPPAALSALAVGYGEPAPWEPSVRACDDDEGRMKRQRLDQKGLATPASGSS